MSLSRYGAYKDSGISWIGELPAHWKSLRIRTLFELMKRPPRDDDGVVTAFRDGEVTLRSNRRTDGFTNSLQEIGYQGVRRGDLVIHAMDAFAGAIGVSDSNGKSTPVYSVCKPRQGLADSNYYGRLLRHMALSGFVESLAKGIRERSTEFRWAEAGNVYLPVPPVAEQTAIVAFLDRETAKINDLIAAQEKLITLVAEKRQATISHFVTRGLDSNAEMKDSGIEWLGKVPKHWGMKRVKHIKALAPNAFVDGPFGSNLKSEHFIEDGKVFVIESNFATQNHIEETQLKKISLSHFETIMRSEVVADDIVIAKIGAQFGKASILPTLSKRAVVSGNSLKLSVNRTICTVKWIHLQLVNLKASGEIDLLANGSAQPALSLGAMNNLPILLPPLTEQIEVVRFVEAETRKADMLTDEAKRAITLLKERRSALIAAAVTGQIDVRGAVSQAAADSPEAMAA